MEKEEMNEFIRQNFVEYATKQAWVDKANELIDWTRDRFDTPLEAAVFLRFVADTFEGKIEKGEIKLPLCRSYQKPQHS